MKLTKINYRLKTFFINKNNKNNTRIIYYKNINPTYASLRKLIQKNPTFSKQPKKHTRSIKKIHTNFKKKFKNKRTVVEKLRHSKCYVTVWFYVYSYLYTSFSMCTRSIRPEGLLGDPRSLRPPPRPVPGDPHPIVVWIPREMHLSCFMRLKRTVIACASNAPLVLFVCLLNALCSDVVVWIVSMWIFRFVCACELSYVYRLWKYF